MATQEQANSFRDEMFVASLEPFTQTSLDFLQKIFDNDETFISLTYDSFVSLTSHSSQTNQNFDVAISISRTELKTQICFDLCVFYLHVKKYDLARDNAIACRNNLAELKKEYCLKGVREFIFCTLNEEELFGCLLACGVSDQKPGLLHRMNESILQQYAGITDILWEDNVQNEISLVNRRILELDIEGAARNGPQPKDLLVQVAALNAIKSILEEQNIFSYNDFLAKYRQQNGLGILVDYVTRMIPTIPVDKSNKLKQFFLNILLISNDFKIDVEIISKTKLFAPYEIADLKKQRSSDDLVALPTIAITQDWKMSDSKSEYINLICSK